MKNYLLNKLKFVDVFIVFEFKVFNVYGNPTENASN